MRWRKCTREEKYMQKKGPHCRERRKACVQGSKNLKDKESNDKSIRQRGGEAHTKKRSVQRQARKLLCTKGNPHATK